MLKGILPCDKTLQTYRLNLFKQICKSIRHGNIRLFSETLETHNKVFLSKFIYLPIEKLYYIIYRRLFKNTYAAILKKLVFSSYIFFTDLSLYQGMLGCA